MYVCVCNAVTETDIKNAVREGANCMHHLEARLAVGTQCGSCRRVASTCLEQVLEQELENATLVTF